MRYLTILFLVCFLSCKSTEAELTAQQIINKSIVHAGADLVANSEIVFKFRDKAYAAVRKNGNFKLMRTFDSIKDVIDNNGFKRFINGHYFGVNDELASKYSNSINSVHYFSVLPFGLNDKAVLKKLLPPSIIKEKEYYKVEITFSEKGGGEDFEDVFIYWIGKDDFLIDYLAYSYHTNGGGKRFRALKNQFFKGGIRFVDYYNYKPLDKDISLTTIDKAFENDALKKVSEIVLEDIEVTIL